MNLKLDQTHKIKSDSMQYTLVKQQGSREIPLAYCSTIQSAIQYYLELKIRCSDISSIQELLNYLKELSTQLNKALAPLKLEVTTKK